ncbi:MAG: FAD/NAD(P)-binding protein [Actinomycetota bacterium]
MTSLTTMNEVPVSVDPMLPRPFRVIGKSRETYDTCTIKLEAADGGEPLRFAPGQFTMIYIYGVGEVPISISGDPGNPEVLVHTVRSVGAVTNAICALQSGDVVGIRGPFGTPWPTAENKDLLIIAGGIGLAPVRPLIYQALTNRDRYSSVALVYGSRSPSDLLYLEEVKEWRGRLDFNVHVTVDRGDGAWRGEIGVVTPLVHRAHIRNSDTVAIVCGPEVMMKVVARALGDCGVTQDEVYVSLERNMKCGIGFCGHCQFGSDFICKSGPVFPYSAVADRLGVQSL